MTLRDELTLDEALRDPLIAAIMRADKVAVSELRRDWSTLSEQLRRRPLARFARVALPRRADPSPPRLSDDCLFATTAGGPAQSCGPGAERF